MVRDLDFELEIVCCPTVREADGLAKSSRNTYLSEAERQQATVIHRSLRYAEEAIAAGERDVKTIREEMIRMISQQPLADIDYVEFVDWGLLQPIEKLEKPALVAVAVRFGDTRLIDNYLWE